MSSAGISHRIDRVAAGLIRHAARRVPGDLAERLEEEWMASLNDVHGRVARLRFALGCCWATTVIAREQRFAPAPAVGAPGHGAFATFLADHGPRFSTRTAAFCAVALLHVGVFFAFIYGMAPQLNKPPVIHPFEPRIVAQPKPRIVAESPPPDATFKHVRIDIPQWLPPPPDEPPPGDSVMRDGPQDTVARSGIEAAFTPKAQPVVRQLGGPGNGFPSTQDYYPSAAIHLGEQGSAVVQACVDRKGRLTAEPTLLISTGSKRLDDGALRLAKAGSGHYRASLENGQPVDSCYPFKVVFTLNN